VCEYVCARVVSVCLSMGFTVCVKEFVDSMPVPLGQPDTTHKIVT